MRDQDGYYFVSYDYWAPSRSFFDFVLRKQKKNLLSEIRKLNALLLKHTLSFAETSFGCGACVVHSEWEITDWFDLRQI